VESNQAPGAGNPVPDPAAAEAALGNLTPAIERAHRGFRSDVEALISVLDTTGLHLALARPIDGATPGVPQEMGEELRLSPHLIAMPDGTLLAALFSERDIAETVGHYLEWTTSGESLDICCLPSRAALSVALELIDETTVVGLLINPGDETELFLSRAEVASIVQSRAIPLVGYVQDIPPHSDEKTLIAELSEPLPPALVRIVESWSRAPGIAGYELQQTFNAERDLEPHLTLRVKLSDPTLDTAALSKPLLAALEGKLPPPGYLDVLFDIVS
jgi:hypothetical protein